MKNKLLLLSLFVTTLLSAQTVYWEQNFNASTSLPTDWYQWNRDGKTVSSNLSSYNFGTNAWMVRNTSQPDHWVASPSWFTPAGQANRWLVSERITIPSGAVNTLLKFDAFPYDNQYRDGIVVRLSTTDSLPESATILLDSINETGDQGTYVVNMQAYAGQTFRLAFGQRSNDKVIVGLDNIQIVSAPNYDVIVSDFYINEHNRLGSSVDVKADFTNKGFLNINKAKFNYSVNGGAPVSTPLSALAWSPFTTQTMTSSTPFTTNTTGTYKVKVWMSDLNDSIVSPDADHSNDTAVQTIFFYDATVNKKILAENYTGAWCGYCPEGDHLLEQLLTTRPNVFGVNIHHQNGNGPTADLMQIPEGDTIVNANFLGGFPSTTFDRKYWETFEGTPFGDFNFGVSDSSTSSTDYAPFTIWPIVADERASDLSPVDVSIKNKTFNDTTKVLEFDVEADFKVAGLNGDFRINAYLTEDSIAKNQTGYNQHNYWCSGCGATNTAAWSYQWASTQAGFVHDHVLRKGLGGAWGPKGSIGSPSAVQVYTRHFSYTIPATMRPEKMNLVAVVDEVNAKDNRYFQVLNADWTSVIKHNTGIANVDVATRVALYPNPVNTVANFEMELSAAAQVKIEIMNALGQNTGIVFEGEQNAGEHTVTLPVNNLANGAYFAKININGTNKVINFTINK
ncbi:MAG: Omp28-related outer membrane protein [Chitinophagales bacterium]